MTTTNNVNGFTSNRNEKNFTTRPSTRMHNYRLHLRTISNGLIEMAEASGRRNYTCNQLLKECYNLVNTELKTYDEWKQEGAFVRKGEHAYLFWGTPITNEQGIRYCPIEFRFCREQVQFREI